MKLNKKLIEVALPLDAINAASVREKSIRHGHPSTLHLWWARRPLASARAVIFAQTVDDPSEYVDELLADPKARQVAERLLKERLKDWQPKKDLWDKAQAQGISEKVVPHPGEDPLLENVLIELERLRLFKIIEDLVLWSNTTNQKAIDTAQLEIKKSWHRTCMQNQDHPQAEVLFVPEKMPGFHDPFAGGGTLPLEALRLGLDSHASDLNPIPVLINKTLIELPQQFANHSPLNLPERELPNRQWNGYEGLVVDLEYYGRWIRQEAEKRIGHLYPKIAITAELAKERPDLLPHVGKEFTVVAYLWARTVASKSPVFKHVHVPLVSTFMVSKKLGNEHYVQIETNNDQYHFRVFKGIPADLEATEKGTKLERGSNFSCIFSGTLLDGDYIKTESMAGRLSHRMISIVLDGPKGKLFVSPTPLQEEIARKAEPKWKPEQEMNRLTTDLVSGRGYGFFVWGDLFTNRQLCAVTNFVDIVREAQVEIEKESKSKLGTQQAKDYAKALGVYLAFSVSRLTMYWANASVWHLNGEFVAPLFGRQAIAMTWDFCEGNPISNTSGNYSGSIEWIKRVILNLPTKSQGYAETANASIQTISKNKIIATDPPYYDNIQYADLSDFFYVWLRPMLKDLFPDLFGTMAVPKSEELVANKSRHGGAKEAEKFFLTGMTKAIHQFGSQAHPAFPIAIYYAFKQSETNPKEGTVSTGWETFLAAVKSAGLTVTGTWPMRTELTTALKKSDNALASSVVLACRPRSTQAQIVSRREFLTALKRELPPALDKLQNSNTAPVDLAQAAIGPGMAVFTRYIDVVESDGKPLTMRQALILINEVLDETLAEQEGDFDSDTRWALTWFDQYGFKPAEYGAAESLATAKNTSISGLVEAGILTAAGGKVQLLHPDDYDPDWDPKADKRVPVWQITQQLARANKIGGQQAGAQLMLQLGARADAARELCYRLYTTCERKGWAADAGLYNMLVQNWRDMSLTASKQQNAIQSPIQGKLI